MNGQLKATQYLFETIRWEWRDKGTFILCISGTCAPTMGIYRARPWTIKTMSSIALRAPTNMPEDHLIYYA
jgi:hypothetical protein